MRVLIVDDEAAARRLLALLIEEIDPTGIEIVGEAADGMSALTLVRDRSPDVILLDITMQEVDGFDVARHLPDPRPLVIFQTAHQQFAIDAFEHDAVDFIVKPIRRARLAASLERARQRLALQGTPPAIGASLIRQAGAALGYAPGTPARLLVRHGAGHRLLPVRNIVRFNAEAGVVYAHTATSTPIADYTLAELEARTGGQFVRTSRADLVNLGHIEGFESNGDGSLLLTLTNSTRVRVSRRRARSIRQRLGR